MNFKNKILGYAIAGLGLAGLAVSSGSIIDTGLNKLVILIPAMILVAIGIMILIVTGDKSKGGKAGQVEKEVPIYKGKEIVGYRVEE